MQDTCRSCQRQYDRRTENPKGLLGIDVVGDDGCGSINNEYLTIDSVTLRCHFQFNGSTTQKTPNSSLSSGNEFCSYETLLFARA